MPTVQFQIKTEEKTVEIKPKQTLLKAAYAAQLDAMGYGECGGNCACATCHVYVLEGEKYLPKPKQQEIDMLDTLPNAQHNSRLGCQLVLPKKASVVLQIPEAA